MLPSNVQLRLLQVSQFLLVPGRLLQGLSPLVLLLHRLQESGQLYHLRSRELYQPNPAQCLSSQQFRVSRLPFHLPNLGLLLPKHLSSRFPASLLLQRKSS